ncbi:GM22354 [Drosophila sechellia]|uniref:GM22354 n=1 Tax=Drosophila sechellia TaxID=7238 RepID=B4IAM5_DROSE|nr:GM22354 [Drosophila sechellia]
MDKVTGQHQHVTRSAAEDDPAKQCRATYLQWIFLLLIFLDVEPHPIPKNYTKPDGCLENVINSEEQILDNEIPGYFHFDLPEGGYIRVIYHVDKYGFYTETLL